MRVVMIFKYGKRFRYAPSFNKDKLVGLQGISNRKNRMKFALTVEIVPLDFINATVVK